MLDTALIGKCTDAFLTPAIVEQFVEAAGSTDPLAITVESGGRLILVPKPKTPEAAIGIIRENVGRAVVRVGLTQLPAGVGVKDASELIPDLVDPCENLRLGTKMFAKIMRIVAKWYGNPKDKEVLPQIFEDAVYSWKSGEFEGASVFQAEEPDEGWKIPGARNSIDARRDRVDANEVGAEGDPGRQPEEDMLSEDPGRGNTGIRIDLSRINGN